MVSQWSDRGRVWYQIKEKRLLKLTMPNSSSLLHSISLKACSKGMLTVVNTAKYRDIIALVACLDILNNNRVSRNIMYYIF